MAFKSDDLYTGDIYLTNNPTWDDKTTAWKAGQIQRLLTRNNLTPETVVEIGCGGGGVLLALSSLNPGIKQFTGYDISPHAIALAKPRETDRIKFFNTDFFVNGRNDAGLTLVIDVIEHVDDVYGFLNKVKAKSDYTIFHVPLDLSCRNLLKPHTIKVQRDNVGHIHYFSKDILDMALEDTGFETIDWFYTKPIPDTTPVKGIKNNFKKILRNFSFSVSENLSARLWGGYSILLLARSVKP